MVFNDTFNSISVLMLEETGENHRPTAASLDKLYQTKLIRLHLDMSALRRERDSNSQL